MDIWEKMYEKAKEQYHPEEVSPFIYAHNVVCTIEADNGEIYTGFCIESCSGVMNLCADRVAALNMYVNSGQTKVKRLAIYQLVVDIYKFPKHLCSGLLMALA